jgi:hypothetical protein
MRQVDPKVMEADIAATAARLAETVQDLSHRLQPKEIGRRSAKAATERAQAAFTTADGQPKIVALAGLGLALTAMGLLWRRKRR